MANKANSAYSKSRAADYQRYASYKMNTIITSAITLLLLLACAEDYSFEIVESGEGKGVHPILIMDVIDIPSTGTIMRIDGEAEIKKAELKAYERIVIGMKVNEHDILRLKKDTVLEIQFEDGLRLVNKPVQEETFFTFEHLNR
jgi:hypothetical protein